MSVIKSTPTKVKFRRSGAVFIAAVLGVMAVLPFAASVFYGLATGTENPVFMATLLPFAIAALLVAVALVLWSWRTGVDVTETGLTVRAVAGSRALEWSDISGFTQTGEKVYATLNNDTALALPGVRPEDLDKLVSVSGNEIIRDEDDEETEDDPDQ